MLGMFQMPKKNHNEDDVFDISILKIYNSVNVFLTFLEQSNPANLCE